MSLQLRNQSLVDWKGLRVTDLNLKCVQAGIPCSIRPRRRSGPRFQPGNLKRNLPAEAHLRTGKPGTSLLFALEDLSGRPKKTCDAIQALGLNRGERTALPTALQGAGRDVEERGHLLRFNSKLFFHLGDQRSGKALIDSSRAESSISSSWSRE